MHASPGDVEEGWVLMAWWLSTEDFQRPHPHLPLGREEPARAVWGNRQDLVYTILSGLSWGTERKHIESKVSLGASAKSCRLT